MIEISCMFCNKVLAELDEEVYSEHLEHAIQHEHIQQDHRGKLKHIKLKWSNDEYIFLTDAPGFVIDKCVESALYAKEDEVNELKSNLQKDGFLFIPLSDVVREIDFNLKGE